MATLEVKNLTVKFGDKNCFTAVNNLSYTVDCGEILGIVGESGSGKSVSSLALMGLIDYPGKVTSDHLMLNGNDLNKVTKKEHIKLLGKEISMIFQDALTSLDPSYTVGFQILETLRVHDKKSSKADLTKRAIELLNQVGIPDPISRLQAYPYQLSGGMSQRVMVAIAIASNPNILIADEPTTALDVTIQAQIIDLLLDLQKKNNMGLILITHDLALVAQNVDKIMVMYAGEAVEHAPSESLFKHQRHPYTQALLKSLPEHNPPGHKLQSLPGVVPGRYDRPVGCMLSPRCPYATERCYNEKPELKEFKGHKVLCHFPLNDQGEPTYG